MSIIIKDLQYVYSKGTPYEKTALSNINLEINDGDFYGIIGHTGSGKSTLINHLNALVKLQSGQITINGIQLHAKKIDYKKLRSTVGMVFQYPEYQLFDETVAKDVAFGPRNIGVPESEIADRVKEAIAMVGLNYDEIAERSPFELSGGQKRRVALAGVLAMRPKILVLDEPTAGLDPRGKDEILSLVQHVKHNMCETIVMISHNMDEVSAVCDKVAVLSSGELVCNLPPRELFSKTELLTSLNIKMPLVTEIANSLADSGLNVPRNVIKESELIDAIAKAKGVANA